MSPPHKLMLECLASGERGRELAFVWMVGYGNVCSVFLTEIKCSTVS